MPRLSLASAIVIVSLAAPFTAAAQTPPPIALITVPPNFVLPNYNGVPVGPFGGLETIAHVARVDDPSAAWFNPAGLSRPEGAQITGSAGLYQFTNITGTANQNIGGSTQLLPNLVGAMFKGKGNWSFGFSVLTNISWDQETDAQIINANGGTGERFGYSADSSYSRRVASFAAGYNNGGKWRFGGGLAMSFSDLRLVTTTSDRVATSNLATLLVTSRLTGSVLRMRFLGGFQVDPTPHIMIGAAVRTPGFKVYSSGGVAFDGTLSANGSSVGASTFDSGAAFDEKLPWDFLAGIAYGGERVQFEISTQAYTKIPQYAMLTTGEPTIIYSQIGVNAPVVTTQPTAPITSAYRAMANIGIGGNYRPSMNHNLRIHFGVTSDLSPVASSGDQVFDKVDLVAWTFGLSGAFKKLQYGAGLNFRNGSATNVFFTNLLNNRGVSVPTKVSTVGVIYALAYQF